MIKRTSILYDRSPVQLNDLFNCLVWLVQHGENRADKDSAFHDLYRMFEIKINKMGQYLSSLSNGTDLMCETKASFWELVNEYDSATGVYFPIYIGRHLYPRVKERLLRERGKQTLRLNDKIAKEGQPWSARAQLFFEEIRRIYGDEIADLLFLLFAMNYSKPEISNMLNMPARDLGHKINKVLVEIRKNSEMLDSFDGIGDRD